MDQRRAFHELHRAGCFVIPNPWDAGSARLLAQLGFRALATTSAGLAWSLGRRDNHVSLEEALVHFRLIAESVDVPVSADFEGGFGTDPGAVGANVSTATATGVAGLSVEDSTGVAADPLFEFALSVERIAAVRRAIDESATGVLLTARSEGFIVGRPDLRRRFAGSWPTPTPVPTACMPPGSAAGTTSPRSLGPCRQNR